MKLSRRKMNDTFDTQFRKFLKETANEFSFLIGKHFAILSPENKQKVKFYGLCTDISVYYEYNPMKSRTDKTIYIKYTSPRGAENSITLNVGNYIERHIIYGDDPDSVKLEAECSE